MQASWFDIAVAGLILFIGLKGVFNGVVRELSGLIGVVVGVRLGSLYAKPLGEWLGNRLTAVDSASALTMAGFLLLLFLVWTLSIAAGVLVAKKGVLSAGSAPDRILGFFAASLKVFVILGVILFSLSQIEFVAKNAQRYTGQSLLYPLLLRTGEALIGSGGQRAVAEPKAKARSVPSNDVPDDNGSVKEK